MRNELKASRLLACLIAPLLFACGQEGQGAGEFVEVPKCAGANQVLSTNAAGQLICRDLPGGAAGLPDCNKFSEALTSNGQTLSCTNRNNESSDSVTALNNLEKSELLIKEYTDRISRIMPGGPAARAVFCGVTTQTTNGAITGGGVTGIAGAAALCKTVATCNQNARMCTVYDMYHSAALGVANATTSIARSWVFMASWMHNGGDTINNGLNDNCGDFTYPTADKAWYGTAVEWKNASTTARAMHFYSGTNAVKCSSVLPIACCN